MPENLKEVDAELRALRDKKRLMLQYRRDTSARRKGLVSSRALARKSLQAARSDLRKKLAQTDSILLQDVGVVNGWIDAMRDDMQSVAEWTERFIQSRDLLNELDSTPIAEGEEEFNEDNF